MDQCAQHVRRMLSARRLKHTKSRPGPRAVFRARTSCTTPTTTRWSRRSTTLPMDSQRPLFIGIVVGAGAREPVLSPCATSTWPKRSNDILAKQVEIRQQYNDDLQKSVDKLLSEEGIKDAASEDLGLVMPGEKRIEVQGLDDDSDCVVEQKVLERQEGQRSRQRDRRGRQGRAVVHPGARHTVWV